MQTWHDLFIFVCLPYVLLVLHNDEYDQPNFAVIPPGHAHSLSQGRILHASEFQKPKVACNSQKLRPAYDLAHKASKSGCLKRGTFRHTWQAASDLPDSLSMSSEFVDKPETQWFQKFRYMILSYWDTRYWARMVRLYLRVIRQALTGCYLIILHACSLTKHYF